MKKLIKSLSLGFIVLSAALPSCRKEEIKETGEIPSLTTYPAWSISRTSAWTGGTLLREGSDTLIDQGICWSTQGTPTLEDSVIPCYNISNCGGRLDHLIPNTTYYVRAYATSRAGTGYGNEESFTTKPATISHLFNPQLTYDSVADIDGNVYKTIEIGTQEWMAENLKTTRFNDGAGIPLIGDDNSMDYLITPGYSWYESNEEVFKDIYGGYYNWFAVNTGKLCPSGWHVPTDEEWKVMEMYLGMSREEADAMGYRGTNAGSAIMESGTINWLEESAAASNESGFTGLPGGSRYGSSGGEGTIGMFWTDTEFGPDPYTWGYMRWLLSGNTWIGRSELLKRSAINVRCIKD
jgi:uncharacterized protein (TIGR02145 family)